MSVPTRDDYFELARENEALRAEVARLKAAIKRHQDMTWGNVRVSHREDARLYEAAR